jgi:hypothetical protein
MRRWRAGRALAALLTLACCGALGYAAVALAVPATQSRAPLPQHAFDQVEAKVRAAQKYEVRAYNEIHNGRLDDGRRELHASKVALADAREILKENGFADSQPSQPYFDLGRAGFSDLSASRYVEESPKFALNAIDAGLEVKKAVLRALPKLTTAPPAPSEPTVTGQLFPSSEPGAVDIGIKATAPINALRLGETGGGALTPKFAPNGWTCTGSGSTTLVCKGPPEVAFTLMIADTRTDASISASGSKDGGRGFGRSTQLTAPVVTTLTEICPATAPKGQSIVLSGTLTPADPGATITIRWTLADGSVVNHTSTTDSQSSWRDAISDYRSGLVHSQAFFAGDSKDGAGQSADCHTSYGG